MGFRRYFLNLWQLFLLGAIAVIFIFTKGWLGFKSVFLGGSSWVIPQLYFLWKMQQVKIIFDSKKMLKIFFLSEATKLLLSFGMIATIFLISDVDKIIFLGGYIFMTLVSFLTPVRFGAKNV